MDFNKEKLTIRECSICGKPLMYFGEQDEVEVRHELGWAKNYIGELVCPKHFRNINAVEVVHWSIGRGFDGKLYMDMAYIAEDECTT